MVVYICCEDNVLPRSRAERLGDTDSHMPAVARGGKIIYHNCVGLFNYKCTIFLANNQKICCRGFDLKQSLAV